MNIGERKHLIKFLTLPYGIIIHIWDDQTGSIGSNELVDKGTLGTNVDGILSLVLAHAIAGVDVESPSYLEGLETAIENIPL